MLTIAKLRVSLNFGVGYLENRVFTLVLSFESYPGGSPYNGLHGKAPPERGTFFRLQVKKRIGI